MLDTMNESRLAAAREAQLSHWQRGEPIWTEVLLEGDPALTEDTDAVLDLIYSEILLREEFGDPPHLENYLQRFPQHAVALRRQFAVHGVLLSLEESQGSNGESATESPRRWERQRDDAPAYIADYEILEEVGRGGMGVVYQGRHRMLTTRLAAIKVLRPDATAPEDLARFRAEANAVAELRHEHIVPIYEFGVFSTSGNEHKTHFVALEWVEGGSLAQKINGVPMPGQQAAEMLRPIADAVAQAHRHGILHRDLKPSNILLTAEGKPKIADFGLAKKLDADAGNTRSGAILGTPSYMAPEQAAGQNHTVGPAADVYALGAILYEMLTGRPPFRADTVLHTLQQVITLEPVPPSRLQPALPRDLETICLKCLQKEPARRYASAQELADDVGRFLRHEPIRARRASLLERTGKWIRRRPASAALVVVGILALIAVTSLWGYFTLQMRDERDEARRQSERAVQILRHARISVDSFATTVRAAKTGSSGTVPFQLACSYSKTAAALANDPSLQIKDRRELSEQYALSAVKLLGCARDAGFFEKAENRSQLLTNSELDALRNRADFQRFLASQ